MNRTDAVEKIIFALDVNGQTLQTNLPASGQITHCPTSTGTMAYSLTITTSPYYGPVSATQIVQAVAPATPTAVASRMGCGSDKTTSALKLV